MRIYAPIEDQTVEEVDQAAAKKSIIRAQLLVKAIDFYLHHPEPSTEELDQLRIKLDQRWISLGSNWINRTQKHLISKKNWIN